MESKAVIAVSNFNRHSGNLIQTILVTVERYILFSVVKLKAPVLRACPRRIRACTISWLNDCCCNYDSACAISVCVGVEKNWNLSEYCRTSGKKKYL